MLEIYVTITNVCLFSYVGHLLRTSWIGLQSNGAGGGSWIDNEEFKFSNWLPGEPDGSGTCVAMQDLTGEWVDVSCGEAWPFVCKKNESKIYLIVKNCLLLVYW